MNQPFLFPKVGYRGILSFLCTLSFLGSATLVAENDSAHENQNSYSAVNPMEVSVELEGNICEKDDSSLLYRNLFPRHKKDKLTIRSVVGISHGGGLTPPAFNLTITPFVHLPNGKIIVGDPKDVVVTLGGSFELPEIRHVPAIPGEYTLGIKVTSTSADLVDFAFQLSNLITNVQKEKTVAIGGARHQISSFLPFIGTVISEVQFTNDFVYSNKKL